MTFSHALRLAALLASLQLHPALAQTDLLNPLSAQPSAPSQPAEPEKSAKDRLNEAKNELAQFNAEITNLTTDSPTRPSDDFINEKRNRLENILRAYEELILNDQRQSDLEKRREVFKEEQKNQLDPEKGPPYAITYKDKLQRIFERAAANVSARELQLEFLQQNIQNQLNEVRNTEASLRQHNEAIETANDEASKAERSAQLPLFQLRLREAQVALELTRSNIGHNEAYLNFEREQKDIAQNNLNNVNQQIRFAKEDLDRLVEKYTQNQRDYSKETDVVGRYAKQVRRDYGAKQQELTHEKEKPRAAEDVTFETRINELNKQVSELSQELERAEQLVEMVQHSIDMAGVKRLLWEARYKVFQQRNPEVLAAASQAVISANRWVTGRSNLLIAKINHAYVDEQLIAKQLKGKVNFQMLRERVMDDAERVTWLAKQLDDEINRNTAEGSLSKQLQLSGESLAYQLKQFWNYEVFTVEDTVKIDGKTVTASRGVTVGKLVKVIAVILLGALAVIILAHWGERHAIKKWLWRRESARLARRWIHGIGFVILTLSALSWANIPLSIFAFMGGALAIGFGFGVQNLLKNLMSGVMLLIERPLRIGDLVELDGIQGSVINIGIRSITIRSGNGIETLVPNSTFIEQKLTNWTYSNTTVRFNFSVGVDYNSPVERVRQLLQDTLSKHPCILKDPAPEVSFDDFGADSLIFNVYYWLEMGGDLGPRQIASELRFAIFKAFADAKINIAYPQRDVHLHAGSPLRVEILNPHDDVSG
jgi:potassium-dependent mechanosensitive channel